MQAERQQLGVSGHSMRPASERPEWWNADVRDQESRRIKI